MIFDFHGLSILIDINQPNKSINIDLAISFPMIDLHRLVTPVDHGLLNSTSREKSSG